MKSLLLIGIALSLSCTPSDSSKKPAKAVAPILDTPIKRDLDRMCNAEEKSGALDEDPDSRANHVGIWLATNLESQEARTLSAELVALAPEPRIARLREVLKSNAVGPCPILATW